MEIISKKTSNSTSKENIDENKTESSEETAGVSKLKSKKQEIFNRFNTARNARIKRNISIFLQSYSRIVISTVVVLLMLVVCLVSLIERRMSGKDVSGAVVSMSELASESKAFAGKSFDADILTYDEMLVLEQEAQSQAQNEAIRQQLDAILSSGSTDKSQSATLSERKDNEVSSVYQLPTVTSVATATIDGSTVIVSSPVSTPVYATADSSYQYIGEYLLTGYCACPICCGAWSNIENPVTSSGAIASANHTVAVDTSVIPFGTELLINGQVYVAEDRGSAIIGNHIDIFFSTHEEAKNWGKQYAAVYQKIVDGSED